MKTYRSHHGIVACAVLAGAAVTMSPSASRALATNEDGPTAAGRVMKADGDNYMNLLVARVDDGFFPDSEFIVIFDVALPGADASTVTVSTGGGIVIELQPIGFDVWDEELDFPDLDSMKTGLDGTWTITVEGPSPSVSTFDLNAAEFDELDFLTPAADVFPAHGTIDVPADVVFSWTRPAGGDSVDFLAVFAWADDGGTEQSAYSLDGDIDLLDTGWDPPLDLDPSCYEFEVAYLSFGDADLIGPLAGDIVWGDAPRAPDGYPTSTPLLMLGSDTIVGFIAEGGCPEDLSRNGVVDFADIIELLSAWGPCDACPEDLDDSGAVDFADIIMLLSAWGPCCDD